MDSVEEDDPPILSLVVEAVPVTARPVEDTSRPTPSTVLQADRAKLAAKTNNNANDFMIFFL